MHSIAEITYTSLDSWCEKKDVEHHYGTVCAEDGKVMLYCVKCGKVVALKEWL